MPQKNQQAQRTKMKIELIIIGVTAFLWFSYLARKKIKEEDYHYLSYEDFHKKYGHTGL